MFHVELPRKPFLSLLQSCANFVSKGDTEAILKQVKISVKSDTLTIQGTNLEASFHSILKGVTAIEEGEILLPCEKALKILKETQDEIVTIKIEGNYSVIEFDGSSFSLNASEKPFDSDGFPPIPEEEGQSFTIPTARLEEMLSEVIYATARQASRYTLNGVLHQIESGKLSLVATDGKRLSLSSEGIEYKGEIEKIIIPADGLNLIKSIPNKSETTKISFTKNHSWYNFGCTVCCFKLLEGRFPKWSDVIPKNNHDTFTVDTKEFSSKLKQTSFTTNDKSPLVILTLLKNRIELSSETTGVGKSKVSIGTDYDKDEIRLGVNPSYLVEALKAYKKDNITFKVKDDETALVVEDGSVLFLIMPVSLKSN